MCKQNKNFACFQANNRKKSKNNESPPSKSIQATAECWTLHDVSHICLPFLSPSFLLSPANLIGAWCMYTGVHGDKMLLDPTFQWVRWRRAYVFCYSTWIVCWTMWVCVGLWSDSRELPLGQSSRCQSVRCLCCEFNSQLMAIVHNRTFKQKHTLFCVSSIVVWSR